MSWTKRAALFLWGLFDKLSEGSEVVDCLYQQLPKDTRKKIEKDMGYHWFKVPETGKWKWVPPSGSVYSGAADQFGQYGVQGAPWKLQAIYDHFDKIGEAEMQGFAKCVAINEVEDRFVGKAMAQRSKAVYARRVDKWSTSNHRK